MTPATEEDLLCDRFHEASAPHGFEDMFQDYTAAELDLIKAKYATEGDVLEDRHAK